MAKPVQTLALWRTRPGCGKRTAGEGPKSGETLEGEGFRKVGQESLGRASKSPQRWKTHEVLNGIGEEFTAKSQI